MREEMEPIDGGHESIVRRLRIAVSEPPRGTGCERGYQIGRSWQNDGSVPEGLCPLAWKVLSLWFWPLRYGGSPRPMEWLGDEVAYSGPVAEHPTVLSMRPIEGSNPVLCGA